MWNIGRYILAAALIGVLVYVGFGQAAATNPLAVNRANVGFGSVISDSELQALLKRHDVVLVAAYMWVSGLTGAHRTYDPKSGDAFLRDSRAKAIESFEKGVESNLIRVRSFAETHTEDDVTGDEHLQTEARSLLNIRSSLEVALAASKSGEPLIYAVEVTGEEANLNRLQMDERVKVFEPSSLIRGMIGTHQTPKPDTYQEEYVDPAVQRMSGQELYQRMKTLASVDNQGG